MIPRYARAAMAALWSDDHRLQVWLDVELAVTAEREARGEAPAGAAERVRRSVRLSSERMLAIEQVVQHDVIAFLSMVAETAGDDARHLHVGLTSSDLVDSALAVQIVEAGRLLRSTLQGTRRAAWELAQRYRRTAEVGRTHGMHAEPVTFGLKCLVWSEELGRDLGRLDHAMSEMAVGKLSGAVGTLAHLNADVEAAALARLGLQPEPVANQVVQRDRHAGLLGAMAVTAGTLEKIAVEIRHLQRSEVREAAEPFGAGQKGSSAMPHKRNPVRSERVSGLARLVRGYAQAAFENQPLWHERDISHSSVERVILPDAFQVLDFMAAEMAEVLAGLVVDERQMRRNLEAGGGVAFSQRVLLALTAAGLPRDEAYAAVQRHALAALDGGPPFRAALESDPQVTARLDHDTLAACFDIDHLLRNVDQVFARAGAPE